MSLISKFSTMLKNGKAGLLISFFTKRLIPVSQCADQSMVQTIADHGVAIGETVCSEAELNTVWNETVGRGPSAITEFCESLQKISKELLQIHDGILVAEGIALLFLAYDLYQTELLLSQSKSITNEAQKKIDNNIKDLLAFFTILNHWTTTSVEDRINAKSKLMNIYFQEIFPLTKELCKEQGKMEQKIKDKKLWTAFGVVATVVSLFSFNGFGALCATNQVITVGLSGSLLIATGLELGQLEELKKHLSDIMKYLEVLQHLGNLCMEDGNNQKTQESFSKITSINTKDGMLIIENPKVQDFESCGSFY